jgi:hypothetical protein
MLPYGQALAATKPSEATPASPTGPIAKRDDDLSIQGPEPRPIDLSLPAAVLDSLLRRAKEKSEQGDVLACRLLYERAAAAGSEAGTIGVGQTYDPDYLRAINATGPRSDKARAIEWYRRAVMRFGNQEALERIRKLTDTASR